MEVTVDSVGRQQRHLLRRNQESRGLTAAKAAAASVLPNARRQDEFLPADTVAAQGMPDNGAGRGRRQLEGLAGSDADGLLVEDSGVEGDAAAGLQIHDLVLNGLVYDGSHGDGGEAGRRRSAD